ncbi:MAG TPA: RNA-binding domain-containing protein [Dissulfurispiraceae bacterium]|nr:RNA-binding domain-containing protein [Dissulfurispiraceae bacterium]
MNNNELKIIVDTLRALPQETEWIEFKTSNFKPDEAGEYISALANSACLHDKPTGYLVFGIAGKSHAVVGTSFEPRIVKVGNEEIENWLAHLLSPRVDFRIHECDYAGRHVVVFKIDASHHIPVKFKGEAFIRVGSYKKKLKDYPEKERKIWLKAETEDWSAQICEGASLEDLDPLAIEKARVNYKSKFPEKTQDVDQWDDITFLNKAKVTIKDNITRTAILLLGRTESEHYISPADAKIRWVLKDARGNDKDYHIESCPLLLAVDRIYAKIRNLKYRYI